MARPASLSRLASWWFLALGVGPLLLLGLLLGMVSHQEQLEAGQRMVASRAMSLALKTEELLTDIVGQVRSIDRFSPVEDMQGARLNTALLTLLSGLPALHDITLADASGRVLGRASVFKASGAAHEGTPLADNVDLRRAVASGQPDFGDPFVDPDVAQPLMPVSIPLTDQRTGRVKAVALVTVRLGALQELAMDSSTLPWELSCVTTAEGVVVASPDPSLGLSGKRHDITARKDPMRGIVFSSALMGVYPIRLGSQYLLAVSEWEEADAFRPFWNGVRVYSQVFLLAAISALALAFWARRHVAAPLAALAATATAIRNGDLEARAEGGAYREAVELARSFNDMTARLLGSMRCLEQEIADRKHAEQELEKSRERLDTTLDAVRDGLWDWSIPTGESTFSPRWYTMLGYKPYEMPACHATWLGLLHPDEKEAVEAQLLRDMASDETYIVEMRLRTKQGDWRWIMSRGKVVSRLPDGSPLRMVGTHTDIHELKQALFDLAAARNAVQAIIDSLPSAMVALDKELVISGCNPAALRLGLQKGQTLESACQQALAWLAPQTGVLALAAGEGRALSLERVAGKDTEGKTVYYDIMLSALEPGSNEGAVLRIDDVTARVRMMELMLQTEKMLTVGGLAAGMAHEINNPLSGILQSVQVVRRRLALDSPANKAVADACPPGLPGIVEYLQTRQVLEFIDSIASCGERAARIVSDMLEFSRKNDQRRSTVNMATLIDKSLLLASSDYDLKKKYDFRKIHIFKEYDQSLGPVVCSSSEIEQVLINLLKNAAQALALHGCSGPEPVITLRTCAVGGLARIQVEDNGPGMDEAVRLHVFDPFFTTKEPGHGTGLGLSVSYFIVTSNHGGSISVDSTPGKGTTFTIDLPCAGVQPPLENCEA